MYRKKKFISKRKSYRKKAYKSTGHYVELNCSKAMTRGTWGTDIALQDRMRVFWGSITGGANNNEVHLNTTNEWVFWAGVYTKYKVVGVKMVW